MIGIIVTGHGKFASGLCHANQMIAGDISHVQEVVFEDSVSLDDYRQTLEEAIYKAVELYNGAIVLTDLKGGTPFNYAMLISRKYDNVAVLSGTNLSILVEGGLLSQFAENASDLAEQLVEVGRLAVDYPTLDNLIFPQQNEEEGGI